MTYAADQISPDVLGGDLVFRVWYILEDRIK